MNKENILNLIEEKIKKSGSNLIVPNNTLTKTALTIKKKFFNELDGDIEEVRLKNIIKNYEDIKEQKGTFSIISEKYLNHLSKVEEKGKINTDKLDQLIKVEFEKYKVAGIIEFDINEYEDENQLVDFIIEALRIKAIKAENKYIIEELNSKEEIKIPTIRGEIGGDLFIKTVNDNLSKDHIKNGATISNYLFYKEIDTFENRSKKILEKVNDIIYYMEKPLYVVDDSHFGEIAQPTAIVGNLKKSVGFIDDKDGEESILINMANEILGTGQARLKTYYDVKKLLDDSYIKIVIGE